MTQFQMKYLTYCSKLQSGGHKIMALEWGPKHSGHIIVVTEWRSRGIIWPVGIQMAEQYSQIREK